MSDRNTPFSFSLSLSYFCCFFSSLSAFRRSKNPRNPRACVASDKDWDAILTIFFFSLFHCEGSNQTFMPKNLRRVSIMPEAIMELLFIIEQPRKPDPVVGPHGIKWNLYKKKKKRKIKKIKRIKRDSYHFCPTILVSSHLSHLEHPKPHHSELKRHDNSNQYLDLARSGTR